MLHSICPYCKSTNVANHGYRKTKYIQKKRSICKDCRKTFTRDDGFLKSHHDPGVIITSLKLYTEGISLSKIKRKIKPLFHETISRSSVLFWVNKYQNYMEYFMKILIEVIKLHIDEGVSPREIKIHLKSKYDMDVSIRVVNYWIEKYSRTLISFYTEE